MNAGIEDLRRDPSAIAGVGITKITDRYDGIIRALDSPPISWVTPSVAASPSSCSTAIWARPAWPSTLLR